MKSYGAAYLRQKAGQVIGGGLILISLALAAGPDAAQEPFQALFGEGYAILYKKEQIPITKVSERTVVKGAPFHMLFGEGYAALQRNEQAPEVQKDSEADVKTTLAESPFRTLFSGGYDFAMPHY